MIYSILLILVLWLQEDATKEILLKITSMEDLRLSVPEMITSKSDMRQWSRVQKSLGKIVALVPTMGFLHDGHLSLIREAKAHASTVVVSIYINPSQFARNEDLSTYPSNLEVDLQKLTAIGGVSAVFCPENIYETASGETKDGRSEERGDLVSCLEEDGGSGHETWVQVERLSKGLCGKSRLVFFRGVTTVVTKLFNVVEPDVAIFGKKDYQQWKVITRMVGLGILNIYSDLSPFHC